MITNHLFPTQELLDDIYTTLGSILVVTKRRTDAVNLYNELLGLYKYSSGSVLCSTAELTISTKAHKVKVQAIENKQELDNFRGCVFTKVFAVGFYEDEELEFLSLCTRNKMTNIEQEIVREKCSYADKYKGIVMPTCGCKVCNEKWAKRGT